MVRAGIDQPPTPTDTTQLTDRIAIDTNTTKQQEITFAKQKEMGIFPDDATVGVRPYPLSMGL